MFVKQDFCNKASLAFAETDDMIRKMSEMQHKLFIDAGHGEGGALSALANLDADVALAIKKYGPPPDRSLPASYQTLARAIVAQQVSRIAASSIWKRMADAGFATEQTIATSTPDEMMGLGLSRRKAEYLIGIAQEITSGKLDLAALADLPGEEIKAVLTRLRGVGAWTADNYRLFALADMDAWPANDIAIQEGMKLLKSLPNRPNATELEAMGEAWRPYRGAGALVLWHIYGILVRKVTVADV
jgi:DNA-3-methyladenine glycosylase II